MFAFLFPPRRAAARRRKPSIGRRFESLDRRLCLSGAPIIEQFQAVVGTGQTVNISGYVSDQNPAGIQVALTGPVSANVTTNSSGFFSYSGAASSLGAESAVATDSQNQSSSSVQTQIVDNPPVVQNLMVTETGNGKYVTVSGQVQSTSPGGLTVSLSGVTTASPVTNSTGQFSVTTQASALGAIDAAATDVWSVNSAMAQAQLTNTAPSLTVTACQGSNNTITISGHVTDMVEQGAVVTIGGIASGTAATDASGNFSLSVQSTAQGTITATATDVWGLVSQMAQTNYSQAPVITDFTASVSSGGFWIFTGTVTDTSLTGITVTLNGVVVGTCTVRADGTFEYDSSLMYGEAEGAEYAIATDSSGHTSNTAQCWVA
ncbi:MAG TPA: hypothetical protein VND64_01800 [Pirellulales bacterium]|nr:hypothetical protein [Pirellulales bacterium]